MIFVELPFLALALIPVVLVEAAVYRWRLSIPWHQSCEGSMRANLWSTFVGVPLSWLAQVVAQISISGGKVWGLDTPLERLAAVTVQSAWLSPPDDYALRWMIPAAALCLLVPCLLVSIAVEQLVLRIRWPHIRSPPTFCSRRNCRRGVLFASGAVLGIEVIIGPGSGLILCGAWSCHSVLGLHPDLWRPKREHDLRFRDASLNKLQCDAVFGVVFLNPNLAIHYVDVD